jgi:hypothetical protein
MIVPSFGVVEAVASFERLTLRMEESVKPTKKSFWNAQSATGEPEYVDLERRGPRESFGPLVRFRRA